MEYDRPRIATTWLWITLWTDDSTGVEMGQCRYEIAKCFKYVTSKSLRNIIYIYLYYINIIYRI